MITNFILFKEGFFSKKKEEQIPKDIYDLKDEINKLIDSHKELSDEQRKNIINDVLKTISIHYDQRPSKEQLKIEVEQSIDYKK